MSVPVPAHPGCPGQNPDSCKTVVCVSFNLYAQVKARLGKVSRSAQKRVVQGREEA